MKPPDVVQGAKDFLGGMGLGMIASQLADLRLGELLDTPPPGLDEAVAIAKVLLCRSQGAVYRSTGAAEGAPQRTPCPQRISREAFV